MSSLRVGSLRVGDRLILTASGTFTTYQPAARKGTAMRAKFRVLSVKFSGDPNDLDTPRTYELTAVYDRRTAENERFAKSTPWGSLTIQIDNPAAGLNVGEEYYLDFTACAIAEAETPAMHGNTHDVADGDRWSPVDKTPPGTVHTDMPAHGTPAAERQYDRDVAREEDQRDPANQGVDTIDASGNKVS